MLNFMACNCSSEQRWNVIEDYFLGREDAVRDALQSGVTPSEEEKATTEPPTEA
jgi:hypothetical protein